MTRHGWRVSATTCATALEAPPAPEELQSFVHKLAGAAGVFNYRTVSAKASALEDSIIEQRAGRSAPDVVKDNLDALLESIGNASVTPPMERSA